MERENNGKKGRRCRETEILGGHITTYASRVKVFTLLYTLSFAPERSVCIAPFLLAGVVAVCLLFHVDPRKVVIPVSKRDVACIGTNMLLSIGCVCLFVRSLHDRIRETETWRNSCTLRDCLPLVAWVVLHEVTFFGGHLFLHGPRVYRHVHKWHHKFSVTSGWTSFYAHPLDMAFLVGAVLLGPCVTSTLCDIPLACNVLAAYLLGATATFVAGHHVTRDGIDTIRGTDHLLHHQKFNVNYGNFDWGPDSFFGYRRSRTRVGGEGGGYVSKVSSSNVAVARTQFSRRSSRARAPAQRRGSTVASRRSERGRR